MKGKRLTVLVQVISFIIAMLPMRISFGAAAVPDWSVKAENGGLYSIDSLSFGGSSSLKIENNTSVQKVTLSAVVPVEAGKSYIFGAKVKSESSSAATCGISGTQSYSVLPLKKTFDWTEIAFKYTANESKAVTLSFVVTGITKGFWIDNVYFKDMNAGDNLVKNPGFEIYAENDDSQEIKTEGENTYNKVKNGRSFTEGELNEIRGAFMSIPVSNTEGVTIDGLGDDWEDTNKIILPALGSQYQIYLNDGLERDLKAEFALKYDSENLYMYVETTDNIHKGIAGANYWQGDSVQFTLSDKNSNYGIEFGFMYNDESDECEIHSSSIADENLKDIKIKGTKNGNAIIYEVAIPWFYYYGNMPDEGLFNILINDNDGGGRRYCVEYAPGIAEGKTNAKFPFLDFERDERKWSAWIDGGREAYLDCENEYSLYIYNYGETSEFKYTMDGNTGTVRIPSNSGVRKSVKYSYEEKGSRVVTAKVENGGNTIDCLYNIYVTELPVDANRAAGYANEMEIKAAELKELILKCEDKGLEVDYEIINQSVIERFVKYMRDDISHNDLSRIPYTYSCLTTLYDDAKGKLEKYLTGEEKPLTVPKYVTSEMEINGQSVYATTEAYGKKERRPVFYVGYGHFYEAHNDIPVFNDFGANTTQIEVGPRDCFKVEDGLMGWTIQQNQKHGGKMEVQDEVKKDGTSALYITRTVPRTNDTYISLYQMVDVEPETTYEFGGWIKAESAGVNWVSADGWNNVNTVGGTYDWKEFKYEYTSKSDATTHKMLIMCDETTSALYIDGLYYRKKGTNENLLVNPSFDERSEKGYYWNFENAAFKSVIKALEDGEKNNVAISLLLSPHYFPDYIYQAYPETKMVNSQGIGGIGGLGFNINHPKCREIIESYLRNILPRLKDYKALNNIIISNEPQFHTFIQDTYYRELWAEHLEKIYVSVDELNRVWGSTYTGFEEIPMPSNVESTPRFYDYKLFNDTIFSGWHRWMANIINEIAPDIPVSSKIMGYTSSNENGHRGYMMHGTAYENFDDFCDLNGNDSWNYIDDGRKELVKLQWYDLLTSIKDAPIINSEDHINQDRKVNFEMNVSDYIATDIWQGGIHSRAISDIWVWHRTYDSSSDFWGSILFRPDAIAKTGYATHDLNRLSYEVTALQKKERNVGILYSDVARIASTDYNAVCYEAYAGTLFAGEKVQFVIESQLDKMKNLKLFILPDIRAVKSETLNAIYDYIKNGGRVLVLGKESLLSDEHGLPLDREKAEYVMSNASVMEIFDSKTKIMSVTPEEIHEEVRRHIDELIDERIEIIDENGLVVNKVEYVYCRFGDGYILNICNYGETKKVKVVVDGKAVTSSKELRSQTMQGEIITLEQYSPILLEIGK